MREMLLLLAYMVNNEGYLVKITGDCPIFQISLTFYFLQIMALFCSSEKDTHPYCVEDKSLIKNKSFRMNFFSIT